MYKFNGMSMDVEQTERERLQSIFPQCFKDGRLDINMLLNLCGEYIDKDFEKYKFEWKGKAWGIGSFCAGRRKRQWQKCRYLF